MLALPTKVVDLFITILQKMTLFSKLSQKFTRQHKTDPSAMFPSLFCIKRQFDLKYKSLDTSLSIVPMEVYYAFKLDDLHI